MNIEQRLEQWPVSRLIHYTRNPRKNDHAVDRMAAAIREFGFKVPLIATSDGTIIDGHLRLKAAVKLGLETVPVLLADDLTPAQIKAFRLSVNRMAGLAEWDTELLALEMDELSEMGFDMGLIGFDQSEISQLVAREELACEPAAAQDRSIFALREDMLFSSSNRWGIPDLRVDRLSEQVPIRTWGGGEVGNATECLFLYGTNKFPVTACGGVLGFYVGDERFESVWTDAVKSVGRFMEFGWGSVVTPDFSVWRDDPLAVQVWNIYRSRWCARYWQEVGLKIIPSLNWSDERSYEFSCAGIPPGVPVASIQCRTTRSKKGKEFFIKGITEAIRLTQPGTLVIYGGLEHRQWIESSLPNGVNYVWLESWTARRKMLGALQNNTRRAIA